MITGPHPVLPVEQQVTFDVNAAALLGIAITAMIVMGVIFALLSNLKGFREYAVLVAASCALIACSIAVAADYLLRRGEERLPEKYGYAPTEYEPPPPPAASNESNVLDYGIPRPAGARRRLKRDSPTIPFAAQVAAGFLSVVVAILAAPALLIFLLIAMPLCLISYQTRGIGIGGMIGLLFGLLAVLSICGGFRL